MSQNLDEIDQGILEILRRDARIEVDEGALGRRITGFVLLNVRPGMVEDVSRQLVELERVSEVHEVHGSEDLIVKIGERTPAGCDPSS